MACLQFLWGRGTDTKVATQPGRSSISSNKSIVFFKMYEQEMYKLDISQMQLWIFDKNLVCLQSLHETTDSNYVGKSLHEFSYKDHVELWGRLLSETLLDGVEIKHTVLHHNTLIYIETKPLDMVDSQGNKYVHGCMLIVIPYLVSMK